MFDHCPSFRDLRPARFWTGRLFCDSLARNRKEKGSPAMDTELIGDEEIARIAREVRVIAVAGLSANEARPSWGVARYLQSQGFRIVPVNPGHAGGTILGETVYADLAAIPADAGVDMVDIFRRPDAVPDIVDQALQHLPGLKVIWMQLGVSHAQAAAWARGQGITVVQNRCPKIEFPRFL